MFHQKLRQTSLLQFSVPNDLIFSLSKDSLNCDRKKQKRKRKNTILMTVFTLVMMLEISYIFRKIERFRHSYFPVNFSRFLRIPWLIEHVSGFLLTKWEPVPRELNDGQTWVTIFFIKITIGNFLIESLKSRFLCANMTS